MRLPSLKHLYYLVNVHKYKHFGKAAQACHVSQSTLSTGIANLEAILNVRLIERDNKNLLFTPLAEEVVQQAQRIILEVDELSDYVERYAKPFGGTLKLGVIPTIAPFFLPQLLLMIKQHFSELKVLVKEAQSSEVLQQLHEGQLDLVLLALPYPVSGVVTRSFYQDRFYFAYHKQTQFHVEPLQKDFSNLEDNSILLLEDGHCLRDHALAACHLERSVKINTFSASSLHTLVQMVNNDLGTTFLPQMAISGGILENTDLQIKALPDRDHDYRDIGFAWRAQSTRAKEIEQLHALVEQQVYHFLPHAAAADEQ